MDVKHPQLRPIMGTVSNCNAIFHAERPVLLLGYLIICTFICDMGKLTNVKTSVNGIKITFTNISVVMRIAPLFCSVPRL